MSWGKFSVVEAQLLCMADLLASPVPWTYAISLAGSEQVSLALCHRVQSSVLESLEFSLTPGPRLEGRSWL